MWTHIYHWSVLSDYFLSCPCNGSGFGSATNKILGNFTVWKHGLYHIAEAIRTRKWHIVVNYIQCSKCLCPNNIVVGRQIWVMGQFVSLHSTELQCFAVAMCFLMSYLPLAAMLKSAEQMLQYAQLFPFFEGLIKSQAFLYSSLNVWFLLLRSEVDVEADVAIFKYFSSKPSWKIHVQLTCVYCNGRRCNA